MKASNFTEAQKAFILKQGERVIDDCTRECLCLVADTSLSGARVARELSALIRIYGKPACIVSGRSSPVGSS